MKSSIFFELQLSHPAPQSAARCFHECAEQAAFADELGYHAVWEVEHPGLTESMGRYYSFGDRPLGPLPVPRDFLPPNELRDAMALRNQDGSTLAMIVGDANSARETVQRFADISLRTFAEQVMPHFC